MAAQGLAGRRVRRPATRRRDHRRLTPQRCEPRVRDPVCGALSPRFGGGRDIPFAPSRSTAGEWRAATIAATRRHRRSVLMFDYKEAKAYWWLFLVSGLLSILIGGALVLWPGKTLTVVGFLIGFWMLFFGIIRFLMALFGGESEGRWVLLMVGIVGIVLGIVVMKNPAETVGIIALIAAIFWIISGLVDVFRAVTDGDMPSRGWVIFGGLAAIAAGAIILLWPAASLTVLALVAGIFFLFDGVMQIVASFQ